jgi:hypothetical protein
MSKVQIGSVRILFPRIYVDEYFRDVRVEEGLYPLFRQCDEIWWEMRGEVLTSRVSERIGEDLFVLREAGLPTGVEAEVSSRVLALDEFLVLLGESFCGEGDAGRRLQFHLHGVEA